MAGLVPQWASKIDLWRLPVEQEVFSSVLAAVGVGEGGNRAVRRRVGVGRVVGAAIACS